MTTKLTEKNISSVANAGINWQSVIVADGSTGTTGVAGRGYFINTTSAAHTFTLPATATFADTILIKDYAGTFATFNLTIGRNGHNIQGVANNSLISTNRASLVLVYVDVTRGWEYVTESNVAVLGPLFVTATGGTVTTSGDFKIHTFTGDGCLVVSSLSNPVGGPNVADYLVIAGGGAGGDGGTTEAGGAGGAGGYRESKDTTLNSPHTASPLAVTTGITLTAQTYPITVGAGGGPNASSPGGGNTLGVQGSSSIFSTITSAGGGAGSSGGATAPAAGSGGSGGGGNGRAHPTGASGNTPPVAPPQGNNGGAGQPAPADYSGGGGGGATAVGGGASAPNNAGAGGAGATSSINGTPTARAGGGGGGRRGNAPNPAPATAGGGAGGTGNGTPGGNGTANTGGGAGGNGGPNSCGGTGGSGIVVIRYKFQ